MQKIRNENLEEDEGQGKDFLKGKDLSREEDIERAVTPYINENEDNFKFMQIDADYYTAR